MLSQIPVEVPQRLMELAGPLPPAATVVVNAVSETALESARQAQQAGLIEPLLVGDVATMRAMAHGLGWALDDIRLEQAVGEQAAAQCAVELLRERHATAVMKGHLHTDTFIGALLDKQAGLRGEQRFTHVFHLTFPGSDKVLLLTDAAVNVAPDVATRFQMMQNAVELALMIGITAPKVAMLSATEEVLKSMPSSVEAAELVRLATERMPEVAVCGPLAMDAILSPQAARIKKIDHPVAGHADVVVAPNIETGNALFKLMVHGMSACAAGIVLGARVPIILTSRADPPEARLASAALAAIVAAHGERRP